MPARTVAALDREIALLRSLLADATDPGERLALEDGLHAARAERRAHFRTGGRA